MSSAALVLLLYETRQVLLTQVRHYAMAGSFPWIKGYK